MVSDPILTADKVAGISARAERGYGAWTHMDVPELARSHEAFRDGIREWAEAKYPDRHGRAVTMPKSDARLIALLGEGNDA